MAKLPNQGSPVSIGQTNRDVVRRYIMHPTLSFPSALHPLQQLIVSPTVLLFSVIPPKRVSVRCRGVTARKTNTGPKGKTSQTGKNPRWVIRRVISYRFASFNVIHYNIRYIRILLIFTTYNTEQRIRSSFLSFHLSLAGLTRQRKWYLRSESPPGELNIYHLRSLLSCLIMLF